MCSSKPPKPDPAIGQAAVANSDIAREQLEVAKQQLAWEKERATVQDPLVQKIVNQQITSGDQNAARAQEQWDIYKNLFQPVERKTVSDAMNFDSAARKEQMAAEAGADVTRGYNQAQDQNLRALGAMGINPASGRFAGLSNENAIAQARDTAGAMNKARRDTELQGIALRTGVAQLGRNLPSTGIAADSTALNAGNSAVGNLANNSQIRNANQAAAMQWFGGAMQGNNSAGSLLNNLYGNQVAGQQAAAGQAAGAFNALGTLGGMGIMAF
ncbi:MAG TPA: hypothetical protein VFS89_06675 [Nitrosospira sp.]|nr:hypothetical protein [Nitrosospira sp.]